MSLTIIHPFPSAQLSPIIFMLARTERNYEYMKNEQNLYIF